MATRNIQDAGEELAYNRRNRTGLPLTWSALSAMNPALRAGITTKEAIWPKPNYASLVAQGMHPLVARILREAYAGVAAKPNGVSDEILETYVQAVSTVRDGVEAWAMDPTSGPKLVDLVARAQQSFGLSQRPLARQINNLLLMRVWPDMPLEGNHFRKGTPWFRDALALGGTRLLTKLQPDLGAIKKYKVEIEAGWPAAKEAWQTRKYRILESSATLIRSMSSPPQHWVMIEPDGPLRAVLLSANHETLQEAKAAQAALKPYLLLDKNNRVVSQHDSYDLAVSAARECTSKEASPLAKLAKAVGAARALEVIERRGPDWRGGRDITAQQAMDTFGFKGVNFGNWVPDKERQGHLNASYDAFMDLADVLGIEPAQISLGGQLGLAIGAQGSGRFAGHFVPGLNEINFTRTAGAGVAAHEWGHALDHRLAMATGRYRGDDAFLSERGINATRPGMMDIERAMAHVAAGLQRRDATPKEREAIVGKWRASAARHLDALNILQQADPAGFQTLRDALLQSGVDPEGRKLNLGQVRDPEARVPQEVYRLYAAEKAILGRAPQWRKFADLALALGRLHDHARTPAHQFVGSNTTYVKESRSMDDLKGGKTYWALPSELFARAFSDWVRDRAAAKGIENDYLAPDHLITTPEGLPRPFLEGDERAAAFSVMDALIECAVPILRESLHDEDSDDGQQVRDRVGESPRA